MTQATTQSRFRIQRDIDKLPVPEKGNRIVYHETLEGFGIRTGASGRRSFVFRYRRQADGRQRTATIGSYPAWPLERAKIRAGELRQIVDQGGDPLEEKEEVRKAPTVADLAERFIDVELPKKRPSTARDYKSVIGKYILPALGKMKVNSVEYTDVDDLHRKISKTAPIQANRTIVVLKRMMNLAAKQWKWRDITLGNPADGVERNVETKRTKYLTTEQISRLMAALDRHPHQDAADAIRILLLTGSRRMEVLAMRWDQINFEGGTWTKPASTTKDKKEHTVTLNAPVLAILSRIWDEGRGGDFVFPGHGALHKQDIKKNWRAVCEDAGLEGFRLHDLRHTAASLLVSSGKSLQLIGQLLGHSSPVTTNRYAHIIEDAQREAADTLGSIVTGEPAAEVIPMRKR